MSDLPPANWYPDPEVPGQQRYWDGTQWTEHRAPGAGADATGQAQAGTPQYAPQDQTYQPSQGHAPQASGSTNGLAITSLVVAILSFFLAFVVIGAVGGVIAVVLGVLALRQLKASADQGGRGLAISGIVVGGLAIVIGLVVVIAVGAFTSFLDENSGGITDFFECVEEAERTGTPIEDC